MRSHLTNRILVLGFFCGAWIAGPQWVHAQGSSLFSGSGVTKGGTGGISGALGGTGFGSLTGGGTGGLGASGAGGLGGALGSLTGNRGATGAGATGMGAMGAAGANSGFVGRTNTAMAGNSRAGQNAGNTGGARPTSRGGAGMDANQNQSNLANAGAVKKSSSIRPRQRVAFDFNPKSSAKVATTISTRLDRISLKNPSLKQVTVAVAGNQIVLTGKVKTPEQSRLAENLLRLEPGVRSIRNELEIEQASVTE
jgi:hypothetical protein